MKRHPSILNKNIKSEGNSKSPKRAVEKDNVNVTVDDNANNHNMSAIIFDSDNFVKKEQASPIFTTDDDNLNFKLVDDTTNTIKRNKEYFLKNVN